MKRFFCAFLVVFSMISLSISASAAEDGPAKSQVWQDGVFCGGVYEGYYAQLDDLQKMIYDLIKKAFSEPKQEAVLTFYEPILLEAQDGGSFDEEDLNQWLKENMRNDCGGRYAVMRDHPELPWLLAVDYTVKERGEWIFDGERGIRTGYRMTGLYYENTYPWVPPEAYANPDALTVAVDAAVTAIGEAGPSRAATVRDIHDYLCSLIDYGTRNEVIPDRNEGGPHTVYYDHTAYSALVPPNLAVCNAYAAAFKLLCDRYEIPCVHLSGKTQAGNHAWNYVQLEDGGWYAVDLTWGDAKPIQYDYFLAGESTLNRAGVPFSVSHEVPPYNNDLPACPVLNHAAYPYLAAQLGGVPETVVLGEPIAFRLSDIKDLQGKTTTDVRVGLFEQGSDIPIEIETVRSGSVTLRYDTSGSKLGEGSHRFYIKCIEGETNGAVLAALDITLKLDETSSPKPVFTDVAVDSPFALAIHWAVEKNITNGTSRSVFSPESICTKGQILTFLWRSQGSPEPAIQNPYEDEVPVAFEKAAVWAYEENLVTDRLFASAGPCTRGEAVTYLWKLADSPEAETSVFGDVPADSDYAKAVSWAVQQGITKGISSDLFSPESICTRGQIVTFLYRAYAEK